MRDFFTEVFTAMKSNRMRIALTGFSIGWGIFILIVLIGSGNGLVNGITSDFELMGNNVVELEPGETSVSFHGQQKGQTVRLYEEDGYRLQSLWGDTIQVVIPFINESFTIHHGAYTGKILAKGTTPGYDISTSTRIIEGRDINIRDIQERRKVCIIPAIIKKVLFQGVNGSVVGLHIELNEVDFEVIGVSETKVATLVNNSVICPISTLEAIFRPDRHLDALHLKVDHLNTVELNKAFNARMLRTLASMKSFAPTDARAVTINNYYEDPIWINNILSGISFFVVVIGLATLISGVVGISNIMMITVKERTRELGVRRAMGASRAQIVSLVLVESVIITVIFGYVGMFLGIGLTQLVSWGIDLLGSNGVFEHPTVDFTVVMGINIIMLIAGLLAGYAPAKRAIDIKLVEALNSR